MPTGFANTTILSPDPAAAAVELTAWVQDDIRILFVVLNWTVETQHLTKWADKMSGSLPPFVRHVLVAPAPHDVIAALNGLKLGTGVTLPLPADAIAVTVSPVSNELRAILITGQNTPIDALGAFAAAEVTP